MNISERTRLPISLAWAVLIAGLTFAAQSFGNLSAHSAVVLLQIVGMYLIVPGLIISTKLFGSSHAFSLVPAAIVNAAFHFSLSRLVLRFLFPRKRLPLEKSAKAGG